MGVLIVVLAVGIACVALLAGVFAIVELSYDGGWPEVALLVAAVIALGASVVIGRTGVHMQSRAECDAVAEINADLDVRHITTTWWSFGCYVDTGNGVVPWGRYRAVIDG